MRYPVKNKNNLKLILLTGLTTVFITLLIIFILNTIFSIPIMYKSVSAYECVKVTSKDDKYSCIEKPNKYLIAWVK